MKKSPIYQKMTLGERQTADFLSSLGIYWKFHYPVTVYDKEDLARIYYPDFYLPQFGIYVEVCGANRKQEYDRRKRLYFANNVKVIFVETYKDRAKWKMFLLSSLFRIQVERITHLYTIAEEKLFLVV
jgi:hypothetical protein